MSSAAATGCFFAFVKERNREASCRALLAASYSLGIQRSMGFSLVFNLGSQRLLAIHDQRSFSFGCGHIFSSPLLFQQPVVDRDQSIR